MIDHDDGRKATPLRDAMAAIVERCRPQSPCAYDPQPLAGQPIGMYHCPECGEMVIAGMPHLEAVAQVDGHDAKHNAL